MIPNNFEYFAPKTIEEALKLIDKYGEDCKILSGGHSLIPVLKLRLAAPGVILDIGCLEVENDRNRRRRDTPWRGRHLRGSRPTPVKPARCFARPPPRSATSRFAIAAPSAAVCCADPRSRLAGGDPGAGRRSRRAIGLGRARDQASDLHRRDDKRRRAERDRHRDSSSQTRSRTEGSI